MLVVIVVKAMIVIRSVSGKLKVNLKYDRSNVDQHISDYSLKAELNKEEETY